MTKQTINETANTRNISYEISSRRIDRTHIEAERDNSSVALQWAPDRKRTGREGNKFHRGEPL